VGYRKSNLAFYALSRTRNRIAPVAVSKGIESQVDAVADFTLRLDFDSGAALTAHDVLSDDERLMGSPARR
jgi:hypothetical protein